MEDPNKYIKLFPSIQIDNLRKESDNIETSIPSFTIIEDKIEFLIDYLVNIENKTVDEVSNFILKYHTNILNYRLFTESEYSRSVMQRTLTNPNFLNILFNSISRLDLTPIEISFLNRITYDYWSLQEKNTDVCNILLQISGYLNSNLIIKLSSRLGVNEAKILAMISNSTDIEEVRVHRINRFLVNCDNPILETQDMIDIMFFIYNRFLYPIVYTLLEAENCCKTEDNIPQYHKLMSAIITILLSTTKEKMIIILKEYGYIINAGYIEERGRIPSIKLKDIKDERLQEVIRILEDDPSNLIIEIP